MSKIQQWQQCIGWALPRRNQVQPHHPKKLQEMAGNPKSRSALGTQQLDVRSANLWSYTERDMWNMEDSKIQKRTWQDRQCHDLHTPCANCNLATNSKSCQNFMKLSHCTLWLSQSLTLVFQINEITFDKCFHVFSRITWACATVLSNHHSFNDKFSPKPRRTSCVLSKRNFSLSLLLLHSRGRNRPAVAKMQRRGPQKKSTETTSDILLRR